MKLVSLLSERRVLPEMTSDTPWDALGELVDHLISIGHVESERREDVLKALHAREEQVSTGIGHGVAIPHAYCDRIDKPVAVLGRSTQGIDFEACDNAPVHFVILLLVIFAIIATRKIGMIPSKAQNFFEIIISGMEEFMVDLTGDEGRWFFPLIATLFIYIASCNLLGLVPGFYP